MKYNIIRSLENARQSIEEAQKHLGAVPLEDTGHNDLLALDLLVRANFTVEMLLNAARQSRTPRRRNAPRRALGWLRSVFG